MTEDPNSALKAIQQAKEALLKGDRRTARRWAERALALAPEREEPWLLLAALASPRASLAYLKHALEINPGSQRGRQGMHWAIQRVRSRDGLPQSRRRFLVSPPTPSALTSTRTAVLPWMVLVLVIFAGLLVGFGGPPLSRDVFTDNPIVIAQVGVTKATRTPTPTTTFTPTPTFTLTPTNTATPLPTDTPTPTPTETPLPTNTPSHADPNQGNLELPSKKTGGDRWIDVDLTTQRISAYQGDKLQRSFIVSTGTWRYPTVTGQYSIYVKYDYADMSGPGYYLPNVPNVMYFYKGYGLHGTYWHNNFGTPMSHGCVNLTIDDSAWLFEFASIGTLVNIHY